MKITYLGHGGVQIDTIGKSLIVDPFISQNPLASAIKVEELKADYILITHGHGDHVLDVETIAKNTGATLISNFEIITWYGQKGIEGHGLNHGGKATFDFGTVKYVNAIHSSMLPDGSNGGNAGGFVIWNEDGCVYVAGDTALTEDMKLIPLTCPRIELAILPIGDNFTMGFEDAALAADFVNCDSVLGCHFDTFPPIQINKGVATDYFHEKGKELILLDIGSSMEI